MQYIFVNMTEIKRLLSPQAPCELNPCMNGATCQPIKNKYDFKCICAPGYHGKLCNASKYIIIIIISLFTLASIYSTYASGAEQITEANNSN